MNDDFTKADRNALIAYIKTDSGRKLLMMIVNYETTLLAEAYNPKTSLEKQGQYVNRVSGLHWARTLIQDLMTVDK
jgi:hypothetical protein